MLTLAGFCGYNEEDGEKMQKINLQELPDKKDPNYLVVLTENVIEAYRTFLSDTMALDMCGVPTKTRSLVLDNPEYKIRTRQIRAEKYLEELDEIDELSSRFKDEVDRDAYQMTDKKEAAAFEADQKTWLAGKLKVAEMRRDLLRMTKDEDQKEEADALNVFFVPVTKAEFDAMETVEVFEGTEDSVEALADASAEKLPEVKAAMAEIYEQNELDRSFKVNADGSVEDWG